MRIPENPAPVLGRGLAFGALVVLALAWATPVANAQNGNDLFDPHPLRPADTSSPRNTLNSFTTNIKTAIHAWRTGSPKEAISRPAGRAFETIDSSQLAQRGKVVKGIEIILLLKEILDRIELPPDEEIPGDEAVAGADPPVTRWTIPNTSITIARIADGPRAGEYLFTAETVSRLREFYQQVKPLPYKPGADVGIFEDVAHGPGLFVPHAWGAALPEWSKTIVFGEAVWQWLGIAIVVVGAFVIILFLLRLGRWWDARQRNSGAFLRFGMPVAVIAGTVVIFASRQAFVHVIGLISDVFTAISTVIWVLIFAGIGWLCILVTSRIADAINEARRVKEGSIDGQLIRTLLRLVSLVLLVFLVLYAADFYGIPLTPVMASLGVGGFALALAIRPTLENIIGGLTLFADKPIRIGDFCRFGDQYGTVEEIGLRSTRLRRLDDTLISVPNSDFSQRELTNYARCRQRLYRPTLSLRYETSPEQLRYVLAKLREMLLGHPQVSPDWLHVRFHGFGEYSLDVEIFAYIRTAQWLEYRAIREDINLRIIDIVKDAGTGFAIPAQTAYLGRDRGIDVERGEQAEREVESWRAEGQLPFPEFDEGPREALQDVLDYPPRGSPDFAPRPVELEPQAASRAAPSDERQSVLMRLDFGKKGQ